MAFMSAAKEIGQSIKASPGIATIGNGQRSSSATAYLKPVLGQENLHVVVNALVTQVLIDKRAYGVEVVKLNSKTRYLVKTRKEIILSAGAIGSPYLLLLSGIGPKEELQKVNIPVVREHLNVGKHLKDHLLLPIYFNLEKPVSCNAAKIKRVKEFFNFFVKRKGYLSWNGVEATFKVSLSDDLNTTSNNMFALLFNMGSVNKMFSEIANYDFKTFQNLFPDIKNESKEGFVLMVYCSNPISEGQVTLQSRFSSEPPLIDPKYLSDIQDVECLTAATKFILKFTSAKAFKKLGASVHKPNLKCPNHVTSSLSNSRFLECWIRTSAITSYHPVGTCRMGNEPEDVVDPYFRMKNIEGLRIVDASVLPKITSGPPNAVVMMLAERASRFILQEHDKYKVHQ